MQSLVGKGWVIHINKYLEDLHYVPDTVLTAANITITFYKYKGPWPQIICRLLEMHK